ncbi:protein translocase subunit SecF [Thermoproteota archaeon]
MSKKRERREKARLRRIGKQGVTQKQPEKTPETQSRQSKKGFVNKLKKIYEKEYKKLMLITLIMFILAVAQIGYQTATTGDFIRKGVSLKGGITITIPGIDYDADDLEDYLNKEFPDNDIAVRILTGVSGTSSLTIDADITDSENIKKLESEISDKLDITSDDYTTNFVGSSLGSNFFRQTIIAVFIAFIAMALVVFIYFRLAIPSLAVVVSALCDIIETIAVINLLGINISTGGIAALLMLIGYSVDTDILLTTRLFKRKEGNVEQNIYSSAKTGLTMTFSSIAAVTAAILLSQSVALQQIMTILLIGLIIDIPNTWIQNTGILKWYIKRKEAKGENV